jgi:iron complex outermembrane receptor protein
MKFRQKKVAVALACAMGVGTAAVAQTPPQQAPREKVEVTGTSIKRVEAETALPVQVITRDDIQKSGATTAMELIDRISAAQSLGNFNTTLGEGTTLAGFNGASLRGLGTQRTLVLLNGRRVAPYALSNTSSPSAAGADLNAIPLSAIERIEVLKDGASAVYGADAVGGVINFILRKDYQGAEATFSYLDSQHGGGATRRLNGTAGWGDPEVQHLPDRRLPEPAVAARCGSRGLEDGLPAAVRRGPDLGQLAAREYRPECGRLRT